MTRPPIRYLAIVLLAAAVEPLRVELSWRAPWFSRTVAAQAQQPFADPGFGDPTTLTGSNTTPSMAPLNPNAPGGYIPSAPAAPGVAVRPNTWPGGAPTPIPGGYRAPPTDPRIATSLPSNSLPRKASPADPPYDPAEILARVGTERIQACEILPMINRAINKAVQESPEFAKLTPEDRQREIEKAQKSYVQQALKEMVNTKLLVGELRGTADKKALDENEKKIRDFFNASYLDHLREEYAASSVIELENKLQALGGSIDSQRALFVEQNLASGWLNQAVKKEDKDPAHNDMLAYYRAHAAEWETPARARWEQLTAKWGNFNSPDEARQALHRWGNDVWVRKVPFGDVAKAHSQDYAADAGGVHDWSSQGSLKSAPLEQALFGLPVGALSRVIEDEEGCHIIRVLERDAGRRAPFEEVQPEIRKQLHDGGISKRKADYVAKLRERVPVWTVFDDPQESGAAVMR